MKHLSTSIFNFSFTAFLLCVVSFSTLSQSGNDYYFFSQDDISNIKKSSQTDWGKEIVKTLKESVDERLKHDLEVPLLEGGHLHDYFCPVHNIQYTFNWDKPTAQYCSLCKKEWKNYVKYNWAWVNIVHDKNLGFFQACMYLYLITDDAKYAEYIRDMLLDYSKKYPTYMEHNTARNVDPKHGGKMFGQSLDESVWASYASKAYSVAKKVMATDEIKAIEKGYLQNCANMLLKRRVAGNWQVWHNSGIMALGVALQNDSLIQVALNDPQCGYHKLLSTDVYNDGWWNEGSPIYHYYPLRAILLSADAVRCRNINLYDKKLYNMLASPALGVYSDLYFPAHNDGWYGESLTAQVNLYEIAYARYQDPFFLSLLAQCYQKTKRNSTDALLNNINMDTTPDKGFFKSLCFENSGIGILRSGDKSVVLKYGPHGGGHGHPDKLSISIHNGKEELVTDLGTSAYGVPDYMQWYRKTLAHSTVTVDAKDQEKTTGALINFSPTKNGGSIEAKATEAYPGVEMSRKLSLQNNTLKDNFKCTSSDVHVYDYVLILTKKPQFTSSGETAVLTDSEVYKRIKNIEKRTAKGSVTCKIDGADLKIQSLNKDEFEIFVGEATGIPPKNPALTNAEDAIKPCYPLIIRSKNKILNLQVDWTFK